MHSVVIVTAALSSSEGLLMVYVVHRIYKETVTVIVVGGDLLGYEGPRSDDGVHVKGAFQLERPGGVGGWPG